MAGSARWTRQGLQVPPRIAKIFKDIAEEERGPGAIQVFGSAAIGVFIGMPRTMRQELAQYVVAKAWKDPNHIEPSEMWGIVVSALRAELSEAEIKRIDAEGSAIWHVTRILDPAILGAKTPAQPKRAKG